MENTNASQERPYPGNNYQEYLSQPMSVGDWFVTILITAIPIVGLVMLFVWAFSSDTNISKANWAKATLIWYLVGIVIAVLIFSFVGLAFLTENFT
jgi:cell division protein FtsW (lipid II flippase)